MGACSSKDEEDGQEINGKNMNKGSFVEAREAGDLSSKDNDDSYYSDDFEVNTRKQKELQKQQEYEEEVQQLTELHQQEILNLKLSNQFKSMGKSNQNLKIEKMKQEQQEQLRKLEAQFSRSERSPTKKLTSQRRHSSFNRRPSVLLQKQNSYQKRYSLNTGEELQQVLLNPNLQPLNTSEDESKLSDIRDFYSLRELENFYFITTIFTPINTKQKVDTYKKFAKSCKQNNIRLITIEYTYAYSPFVVTQKNMEPYNFQIKIQEAMYLKYNMVNNILDKIPDDWGFMCIVDYNVLFQNFDWLNQCKKNLQTTVAQQLFDYSRPVNTEEIFMTETQNYDEYGQKDASQKSSMAKNIQLLDLTDIKLDELLQNYEHGKAWAFRKDFVQLFGLQDFFITGFGEMFFMLCMLGKCTSMCKDRFSKSVIKFIEGYENDFQDRELAFGYIEGNSIDYVQINLRELNIQDSIRYMKNVSDKMQKDDKGIFYTENFSLQEVSKDTVKYSII